MFCDGQLLPLSQNTALFSLLGTTYGGDGKSNFALPDLQGQAPMHPGQGPGLSLNDLGERGGTETVNLLASEIPAHQHTYRGTASDANSRSPGGALVASDVDDEQWRNNPTSAQLAPLDGQAIGPEPGSDQPHNNMQPYLTLNFCIALQGVYPPRS